MNFLVDAQLPKSLSNLIVSFGFNSKHTLELIKGNSSADNEILELANLETRVIISKDTDFLESYLLFKKPAKLVIVRTGNISNNELLGIFKNNFLRIVELLETNNLIEVSHFEIVVHP